MRIRKLTKVEYHRICNLLKIDSKKDKEATIFLNSKLNSLFVSQAFDELKKLLLDKDVFIYAAGPSLPQSIQITKQLILEYRKNIVVIAVDGATKALLEQKVPIDIIVSDLDGSQKAIIDSYQNNHSFLIIHAHGDNSNKITEFEDHIGKKRIIGSTQLKNVRNVKNFGGFTDGDRAVYVAANFKAHRIFLFAFDFGDIIGKYSKPEEFLTDEPINERKKIKLQIAKKLLEKVPKRFKNTFFFNCTQKGEKIASISNISYEKLIDLLKEKT
ncbi:MAG: 6-hydroxymethylpterin diphosphokinase MptE-like protein [Candidatus Thorarchaeota archaeon]